VAKTPSYHPDSSVEADAVVATVSADDLGGWGYDNVTTDANIGNMLITCTHTDTKGTVWTTY